MGEWLKSSFCAADEDMCVEVRFLENGDVEIRDGKLGTDSPVLQYTADEWRAFDAGLRNGDFDRQLVGA
jgi:hypothetical protein